MARLLGEVISILSGKGGTGKTTLCAALATCLAEQGNRVLCIDLDVGLRNLDIALGMADEAAISFTDVLHGRYSMRDATPHPVLPNLFLLTAPLREEDVACDEAFGPLIAQAKEYYDYCLMDAPAGVSVGFRLSSRYADRVVVVATPDPASLRDAARVSELLSIEQKEDVCLAVNRIRPRFFAKTKLTVDDMMDSTGLPLLGLIPDDANVPLSAFRGVPLIFSAKKGAAEACRRMAQRLCGKMVPLMKF